jgi:hypothetical protein
MKILWLGAGASISAGYPATGSLLSEIGRAIGDGADVMTEEAWQRFCEFRESATGIERFILKSPNPEIVLTYPDLLVAALDADNEAIEADTRLMARRMKEGTAEHSELTAAAAEYSARYNSSERVPLENARSARHAFQVALNHYFARCHYEDGQLQNADRRDALRRELAWLEKGDAIITTNWDTTVERTLLEQLLWTPKDGYGFPIELVEGVSAELGERRLLPRWVPETSQVRVLKLHGSFGWLVDDLYGPSVADSGEVFLDYSQFLSVMPFVKGDEMAFVRDVRTGASYESWLKPYYVVPSYLKNLTGPSIQRVWYEASVVLSKASELRIVGASLPSSDLGIRTLLNAVRFRVADGAIKVAVHDPEKLTHTRWTSFLGNGITTAPLRIGESA